MSENPSVIGRNIKYFRKLRKLRQGDLADISGVPQGDISKLETGFNQDVFLSRGYKIAQGLGVSLDDLARERGDSNE